MLYVYKVNVSIHAWIPQAGIKRGLSPRDFGLPEQSDMTDHDMITFNLPVQRA